MRKVYIVFAYNRHYPTGPDDVCDVYLTQEAAEARVAELRKYTYTFDYPFGHVDWYEFTVLDSNEENVRCKTLT
jgi:hypothetical protein